MAATRTLIVLTAASCGGEGTRTPNPLLAKQVRYQLRHAPEPVGPDFLDTRVIPGGRNSPAAGSSAKNITSQNRWQLSDAVGNFCPELTLEAVVFDLAPDRITSGCHNS